LKTKAGILKDTAGTTISTPMGKTASLYQDKPKLTNAWHRESSSGGGFKAFLPPSRYIMKGAPKMTMVYPVIFTKTESGYVAHVPDMDIDTQGRDLAEAIYMARDAIGIMGIDMQDEGKPLPSPSDLASISREGDEIISMVDIDFDAYRRVNEQRTVRRNVSLPSWLDEKAAKAGINVSATLKEALIEKLASANR
jgi:predicted RNase H-like HicB family nuclease